MSLEHNKEVVAALFERFATNDIDGALDYLSDDATWWIVGRKEALPPAGPHTKEEMAGMFRRMARAMPGGMKMTVVGIIAEGDRLAVELTGHGELANGRVYENQYHLAMRVRDGKVCEVREYLDTQHVFSTWFAA